MQKGVEQISLVSFLLANWPIISGYLNCESPDVQTKINGLVHKLSLLKSEDEPWGLIEELLYLLYGTKAETYVRGLIDRSRFPYKAVGEIGKRKSYLFGNRKRYANADLGWAHDHGDVPDFDDSSILGNVLSSGFGAGISQATAFGEVDIYFATNREWSNDLNEFGYNVSKELKYGSVKATVPVGIHKAGRLEKRPWWNLLADKNNLRRYFAFGELKVCDKNIFLSGLVTGLLENILIFIHGYNVTFEEAILRSAQLAVDLEFNGRIVLFSWPSSGWLLHYSGDEERAVQSALKLNEFLSILCDSVPSKINLLAHSMGSRVVVFGLSEADYLKKEIEQVLFFAGDINIEIFDQNFSNIRRKMKRCTSYVAQNDIVLLLSVMLHQSKRIGYVHKEKPYVVNGMDTIDATSVNEGFLGHGYYSHGRSLVTDISVLISNNIDPSKRGLKIYPSGQYWFFPK